MAGVLRIAIVDPADASRENLRNTLLGVEGVWLEAECSRYEFFGDVIQQSTPDVAIVTLDADPDKAMRLIESVVVQYRKTTVLAASTRTDGHFILQAIQAGAKNFIGLPVNLPDLLRVLEKVRIEVIDDAGGGAIASRVYAFTGSRGGAGSTSLAVNFGCILALNPANSVALLDLDLAMGDADVCLDIVPDYTLADVALSIDRIDLQLLKRSLSKHSSGLYLLPHPVQIDDAGLIHHEHVTRVVGLLKMTFTHIILDLSKGFQPIDFAALQAADEIILVTQLDVSSLRNVVRIMLSLTEREGLQEKVKIVANRVGSSDNEISVPRAEETIGRSIFARVPNDSRTMIASRNSGIPLIEHAPKSKLYQAIVQMTETLVGQSAEPVPSGSGGGLFGGIFSRKK